jgi:hypothetical protein
VLLVSFNAHTSLCNQSVSFHAPPWQWCQGIKLPTKGSLLLSPRRRRLALRGAAGRLRGGAAGWVASRPLVLVTLPRCCVAAAAAAVAAAVTAVSSGGAGDGGGAGFFPGGVAFDDFFPCQRWD